MGKKVPWKQTRIRKRNDFLRILNEGRRWRKQYFTLIFCRSSFDFTRFAVVVSKKIGKAVVRNKIKRLFREIFRRHQDMLPPGIDLILISRPGVEKQSFQALDSEFSRAVHQIQTKTGWRTTNST